jgi:hypothetical protein
MYSIGKKARLDEETIVETIILNMLPEERKLFRIYLAEDISYEKLLKLIARLECNENEENIQKNNTIAVGKNTYQKEFSELLEKVEKMAFAINNTNSRRDYDQRPRTITCKACRRIGHSEYECRNRIFTDNRYHRDNYYSRSEPRYTQERPFERNSYQRHNGYNYGSRHENAERNDDDRRQDDRTPGNQDSYKMQRIKRLLNRNIFGQVRDYKDYFTNPSAELQNLFQNAQPHYDLYKTIARNDMLADECIKHLEKRAKINNIEAKSHRMEYDLIKCRFEVNDQNVESILDTGANFSVISRKLTEELNLPINLSQASEVTLANNQVSKTRGTVQVSIKIDDTIFSCTAAVLEGAAHQHLIGTNWIAYNKAILDFDRNTLKITRESREYLLPIFSTKIQSAYLREMSKEKTTVDIFAAESYTIYGTQIKSCP